MTPLRLFILALLFYAGWRLLRKHFGRSKVKTTVDEERTADREANPQDILVEDPVCHVLVPKHQAVRLRKDGVTYYFCSEQCCDQFAGKPEQGES